MLLSMRQPSVFSQVYYCPFQGGNTRIPTMPATGHGRCDRRLTVAIRSSEIAHLAELELLQFSRDFTVFSFSLVFSLAKRSLPVLPTRSPVFRTTLPVSPSTSPV